MVCHLLPATCTSLPVQGGGGPLPACTPACMQTEPPLPFPPHCGHYTFAGTTCRCPQTGTKDDHTWAGTPQTDVLPTGSCSPTALHWRPSFPRWHATCTCSWADMQTPALHLGPSPSPTACTACLLPGGVGAAGGRGSPDRQTMPAGATVPPPACWSAPCTCFLLTARQFVLWKPSPILFYAYLTC